MLPSRYNDWTDLAKQRFQAARKLAASLHDYIDVTDEIGARVNDLLRKAEEHDAGDGLLFVAAGEAIKRAYLTKTFH